MSNSLRSLFLVDSRSRGYRQGIERVRMYLDHFRVVYAVIDLAHDPCPQDLSSFPLVIAGHPGLNLGNSTGWVSMRDAVAAGSGLVSFDPELSSRVTAHAANGGTGGQTNSVEIAHTQHFITARHRGGETWQLGSPIDVPGLPGEPLVIAAGNGLLTFMEVGEGRIISWASSDWMETRVLGPMSGLDDLFWRGLVWAARKPFCLRGLPPLVTMRVDDVAGRGDQWEQSPLYWVDDAVRAGFKPWLGLFIYNLNPQATNQLRDLVACGNATAFPHAFGRPPRGEDTATFYYHHAALAPRSQTYDEFIYFDHQRAQPWSDVEAERGLCTVEAWYADQAPLPMSRVAMAHWYEMGTNTVAKVRHRWGCDFLGKVMAADRPLLPGETWLRSGPFRSYEPPGESYTYTPGARGMRPVYYADFVEMGGETFFNSVTEIRDDAGYEWTPNNAIESTVERGVRQLRRALDAMALASLFTHETDYLYRIRPDHWREIIEGVARGIASYAPWIMTLDEGLAVLRATRTSRLSDAHFDDATNMVAVSFEGEADRETGFYLFAHDGEEGRLHRVPVFEGRLQVTVPV